MWAELREADPKSAWTLNAGGMAYGQVGRDAEAVEWLEEGVRAAFRRDDPEHVVDQAARARWPGRVDSLVVDEPFEGRRERMERHLRERRAQGDGPLVVVRIGPDGYAAWCAVHGHEPIDRRSRSSLVEERRALGEGRIWPPGRNELCWCGSERTCQRRCGT